MRLFRTLVLSSAVLAAGAAASPARAATEVGQALGVTMANNVLENALLSVHGNRNGQQK